MTEIVTEYVAVLSKSLFSDPEISSASSSADSSNGEVSNLEHCSVEYFAGYLGKRRVDEFSCEKCEKDLTVHTILGNKQQMLIINKNYGKFSDSSGLKVPSDDF